MSDEREALRAAMRARREAISMIEAAMHSVGICERVLALPEYQRAQSVMCYCAKTREVQTNALLQEILRSGRRLFLPRVQPGRRMEAVPLTSLGDLRPGPFDILEPLGTGCADPSQIELLLIPGLAFDAAGGRLGYGAGYYDRFLPGCRGLRAGLAYDFQVVPNAYSQTHDVPMDLIITQSKVYDCRQANGARR